MARIAERRSLVEHVAGKLGVSVDEARSAMDAADAYAVEAFFIGNTVPFEFRH